MYNQMAGGENNSRLRSMIYPNGRILDYTDSPNQQPVTTLSSSGTVATATTAAADGLSAGDKVIIEGAGAPYDGTFTVASVINSTQFTYTLGSSFTGSSSGTDISAAKLSLDSTISRVDGEQDHGGSAAGQVLEGYSYLGLNTIVQRTRPDGANLSYISQNPDPNPPVTTAPGGDRYTGLDAFGRVIDQLWGSATAPVERYQYAYDRDGNVLYKKDLVNPSNSELYHANGVAENSSYDSLNRLTAFERGTLSASGNNGAMLDQITAPSTSQNWTLDALGNWSADTGDNGSETRTFNAQNQIVSASGNDTLNPTYDNNGNMTNDGQNTYIYDAWNHLVKLQQSGNTLETRSYYATGEMSSHTDTCQSVTTRSYYSMDWQAVEDDTQTGSGFPLPPFVVANQYVWGQGYVDDLVVRDDNSSTGSLGITGSHLGRRIFAQQDANWNVTALVTSSGTVLARTQYNPYGSGGGLIFGWAYGFQGGRVDLSYGFLYDFRNRVYNTREGLDVWMQQDPTGTAYVDGMGLYELERGDPTSKTDPAGTQAQPPTVLSLGMKIASAGTMLIGKEAACNQCSCNKPLTGKGPRQFGGGPEIS